MASQDNSKDEILQFDASDPTLKELSAIASRIESLLNSPKAQSDPEFIGSLDDFLGAVYALVLAKHYDFEDRPARPIEVLAVVRRAQQLAQGRLRRTGKWMAGFYFNSALFRISAVFHRTLKIVTRKNAHVPVLSRIVKQWFKQRMSREWPNANLESIHKQVNELKHAEEGIYEKRRNDAGFQNAVAATKELLDLMEVWAR